MFYWTIIDLLFIWFYLFLAVLGLCCFTWAFSSWGEWELLFTGVVRLLVVASLVMVHRFYSTVSVVWCIGLVAPWPWDLPGSGIEPMFPALAGRFFATELPGKPCLILLVIPLSAVDSALSAHYRWNQRGWERQSNLLESGRTEIRTPACQTLKLKLFIIWPKSFYLPNSKWQGFAFH